MHVASQFAMSSFGLTAGVLLDSMVGPDPNVVGVPVGVSIIASHWAALFLFIVSLKHSSKSSGTAANGSLAPSLPSLGQHVLQTVATAGNVGVTPGENAHSCTNDDPAPPYVSRALSRTASCVVPHTTAVRAPNGLTPWCVCQTRHTGSRNFRYEERRVLACS